MHECERAESILLGIHGQKRGARIRTIHTPADPGCLKIEEQVRMGGSYLHQYNQIFRIAASAPDCFGSVVPAIARVVGGRFQPFSNQHRSPR